MLRDTAFAARRAASTIGLGMLMVAGYVVFASSKDALSAWEAAKFPVLAPVLICDGEIDTQGRCDGDLVRYAAFLQTDAHCDEKDAVVSGYLSKAREDATYIDGRQAIFYGSPWGRFRRAGYVFEDQDPGQSANRPAGLQDWGPWRLRDGCSGTYRTWFTTVEHEPWHGLYRLRTTSGPFPLPDVLSGDDEQQQKADR